MDEPKQAVNTRLERIDVDLARARARRDVLAERVAKLEYEIDRLEALRAEEAAATLPELPEPGPGVRDAPPPSEE